MSIDASLSQFLSLQQEIHQHWSSRQSHCNCTEDSSEKSFHCIWCVPVKLIIASKRHSVDELLPFLQPSKAIHPIFGENVSQELIQKIQHLRLYHSILLKSSQWRFIGHLQRNKVTRLLTVMQPMLSQFSIDSVDSVRLAQRLNRIQGNLNKCKPSSPTTTRLFLRVLIQVNTSGEIQKSGVAYGESALRLVDFILHQCPHLEWRGFMCIAAQKTVDTAIDKTVEESSNSLPSEFELLNSLRLAASNRFHVSPHLIELSMGMSQDFQQAIANGATHVRIGTKIFSTRND